MQRAAGIPVTGIASCSVQRGIAAMVKASRSLQRDIPVTGIASCNLQQGIPVTVKASRSLQRDIPVTGIASRNLQRGIPVTGMAFLDYPETFSSIKQGQLATIKCLLDKI